MENIFKINIEPNINYERTNLIQIKNILKNLRLNISEEIKLLSFIKQNIEKNDVVNKGENIEINEKLLQKYSTILIKLSELCIEEINYISETLIILDKKIKENVNNNDLNLNKDDLIYDKIELTFNNYNKIVDNINKTISSLPYIFNLYLLYNKTEEEENKFIRNNMEIEEKNFKNVNNAINLRKIQKNFKKEEGKDLSISKRVKIMKFSEFVQNLNNKKNFKNKKKLVINKDEKNININIIKAKLQEKINELKEKKSELKSFIFKNCVKENELKNLSKIKDENKVLKEEISNLKNLIQKLNDSYEYQNDRLDKLKEERKVLENENSKLIEYINNILSNQEKNKVLENNINNLINNREENEDINYNIDFTKLDDLNTININHSNFESIEMLKRLNKL